MPRVPVVLALLLASAPAGAQIIRPPRRSTPKTAWTNVSIGLLQLSDVRDGSTQSEWQFGNAVQYRVTLEKTIQSGTTFGVSGAFARVPLTYVPLTVGPAGCTVSCDADATVTQLVAMVHAGGGGIGFHQVIELVAGATGYSSFRARASGAKLPPLKLDADLTLGFGYGFGYAFSPDMQVTLVQEGALTVHQRTGVPGGENTLGRHYTTRVGIRFGL